MNKKEILIICMIMCFIFSISAVSAADVDINGTDDTVLTISETDDVVEQSNDLSSYSLPENATVLKAGSEETGSFSDLNTAINGDDTVTVITLDKNYTFDSSTDSDFVTGITISRSLEIIGNGFTINGNNQARIFDISGESTVTLTGITFINGNSGNLNGGAIYSSGTVDIDDCKFINNTANRGGALYLNGHDGTITGCKFEDNKAAVNGGAVRVEGSGWKIEKSTFNRNNATNGSGGAIYLEESLNTIVDTCNFTDNYAGINGGAVEWYKYARNGQLLNSIFTNNTANRSGGAVYWYGQNGTIRNVTFDDNKALGNVLYNNSFGNMTYGGHGGAIMWTGIDGNIDNCTFTGNNATTHGGAIFMQGSIEGDCSNMRITNIECTDNFAGVNGGAVDWYKGAHDCILENATFTNNIANRSGGAVFWFGQRGTIRNATFIDNKALGLVEYENSFGVNTTGGHGGAVMWTGADGTIDNCTFIRNNAAINGGAVFMQGSTEGNCSNLHISNIVCEDNFAGVNGGAVDWYKGAYNCTLENATFNNNTANRSGGAVFWFGHLGTIINASFYNNSALGNVLYNNSFGNMTYGGHGGAIMWTGADGTIDNCIFIENKAAVNGGAVFMQGSTEGNCSNLHISNIVCEDNFAGVNGGAVDWYKGAYNCTLVNATFNNNIANRSGGAVFWFGKKGTIVNASFYNNSALGNVLYNNSFGNMTYGGHGGAIMWTGEDGHIENITCIENRAKVNGGAIFLQGSTEGNCSNVIISDSIFKNNTAGSDGGAVEFYDGATDGHILNSTFENNTATTGRGGAVFWNGYAGEVSGSSFSENYAQNDGGALYVEGESCKVSNSTFDNNTAGDDGGAIYWTGDLGSIHNITANNNSGVSYGASHSKGGTLTITGSNMTIDMAKVNLGYAEVNGGAIFLTGNNVNVTNSEFTNNKVQTDYGGALYIIGNNTHLINTTIENSTAIHGGGIYWEGNDGYADNIKVIRNSVTEDGAGMTIIGERCEIYNSTFADNTAHDDGGAIQWSGSNGKLYNSNFTNNCGISNQRGSASRGGAISLTGSNVTIDKSNFTQCYVMYTLATADVNRIDGGALFITGNNVTVENSIFKECNATHAGGAIYVIGNSTTIDGCDFTDNYVDRKGGGAIFVEGTKGNVLNSNFTGNIVNSTLTSKDTYGGGAIFWTGGKSGDTIKGCIFTNNTAHISYSESGETSGGGAIFWARGGSGGDIEHCEFYNNSIVSKTDALGGAINWDRSSNGVINNCTFVDNYATTTSANNQWVQGGALYWRSINGTVNNSKFINCWSDNEAGAIYWSAQKLDGSFDYDSDGYIINCTFENNYDKAKTTNNNYKSGGGAVLVKESVNVYFINSTFTNNTSLRFGGAISVGSNTQNVNCDGCTFINNTCPDTGGALYWSDGYIYNSKFINNSVSMTGSNAKYGGAVYSTRVGVVIVNSSFENNTIPFNRGGAVYLTGNNINITNTTFKYNSVLGLQGKEALGGALWLSGSNDIVDGCKFIGNTVNGTSQWLQGGALAVNAYMPVINNSYFADNYCEHEGGAIYLQGNGGIIDNCTFERNTANGSQYAEGYYGGGALYLKAVSNAKIINSNITNNSAVTGGGAFLYSGSVTFTNCNINDNTAETGAGVYNHQTTANFNDCVFSNNIASNRGGGIYYRASTTFNNATFNKNNAEYGGAIYTDFGKTIEKIYAYNNTAVKGGAIYLASGGSTVQNSILKFNKADYGSAIYSAISTNDQNIYNVVVLDNQAVAVQFAEIQGTVTDDTLQYSVLFVGGDNILNGIYDEYSRVYVRNVTYWGVSGGVGTVLNSGSSRVNPSKTDPTSGSTGLFETQREAGINITLTVYDENNNVKYELVEVTDIAGNVTFTITDPDVASYDMRITHFEDNYYTELSYATKNLTKVKIDVHDIYYGHIEFANVTVTPANSTVQEIPTGDIVVYIDGEEYGNFTLDENGKYALDIAKLTVGNHTIRVQYKGDPYFLPEHAENTFEVLPVPYELIINVTDYYYGNVGKGTVTVADYVTGLVNITIDGQNYTVDVTRDKTVEFEFQILNVGNYTIYASYPETDTYFGYSNSTDFEVLKVNSTINIEVNYGRVTEIIVTVGEYNCTGNITITVDGDEMNFTLVNGQAIRQVTKLASGNHTINATYHGDYNHYGSTNETIYEVIKANTPIEIDVRNMTYGENQTMIIRLPTDINGENITVTFNGETKNYTVTNGKVTIPIGDLAADEYSVSVYYEGNEFYLDNSTDSSFWINKATPEIDVEVEDIIYNTTEEHIAVNINQTGNVTIRVIDKNNNSWFIENPEIVIANNQVTWNISSLPGGDYIAEVTYNGNQNYTSVTVNKTFTVKKAPSNVTINITNAYVGETTVINVTVSPDRVTGNVSVYIDGVEYVREVNENGTVIIEIGNFTYGNHSVVAVYDGDRNYSSSRNNTPFMVEYNPNGIFIITAQNITVGENETISVTVPDDAQGLVLIDVGGVGYYINLTAGQRSITVPNLDKGLYDVNGTWINDPKYGPLENTTNFTVTKNNITIGLELEDIDYGQTEVINVTVGDATGNVTIKVNNTVFKDVPIVNGVVSLPVANLPAGSYVVNVTYNGDRKYNVNGTTGKFTVRQITIPIEIVPQNITFGEKETIKVYVNATGNVTVSVDGQIFEEVPLVNGAATVEVEGYLIAGNYTVEATFNGNSNYTTNDGEANFTVSKANVTIEIDVQDIPYGDVEHVIITVRAIGDAQGNVTITVAGNTTTIVLGQEQTWILRASVDSLDDYEGQATWNIYNLPVGTYPVTATYNGNENFNPLTIEDSFIVYQIDPELEVEVGDIYVWDTEVVNITLHKNATGEVLVYVDANTTPISVPIVNGTAQVNLTDLTKGTHSIWVFYDGDLNFTSDRAMKAFEVKLRTPTITVNATNITVGDVEEINVTIPANATGYVVITGNCTDNPIYIDTFVNGNATIKIKDLPVGNYTVHVKYYGDGNYTEAEADTAFEVINANATIAISVEDIDYGQAANITVTVTPGATGNITIKINDTHEITLPIANGKVNWIVEGLAADNYTVYATYSGDDKYNVNETNRSFEVRKITPEITIEPVEVDGATNATVIVHITPGTTGNINITVNNKNYTGIIDENGVARITVDILPVGEYDIVANYGGDKNYTNASSELAKGLNVTKVTDYVMNVTAIDVKVGENTTITVNVPKDATGNVTIWVNGTTTINTTIVNGVATFNITKDIEGKYTVNATLSDPKYANKTVETVYYVTKNDTPMNITVLNDTLIYVGDVVKVVVSVPSDATGNVTLEIDGKTYTNETINGNATFYITDLIHGDKSVYASYEGNNKYVFNSTTANFTVYKRDSFVKVNVTNTTVGSGAVINVTVPDNATGQVIVSINGTDYSINVTNGTGNITIYNLGNGTYDVNVTYTGDEQYLSSSNSTKLGIEKINSTISVNVDNITVGDVAVVNITVITNATGNVTIKIGDEFTKTVGVIDGVISVTVPGLTVGNKTVEVIYNGDDKYLPSQSNATFKVNKKDVELDVIDQGNRTVVVTVSDNATGNITIKIGGETYNATIENGKAVITLTNATPGDNDIEVIYSGDDDHNNKTTNAVINAPKYDSPISVKVESIYVGDVAEVTVELPENATGDVTIEINGKVYEPVSFEDGVAKFEIENLTFGNKTVAVKYSGDSKYLDNSTTANFTVYKRNSTVNVTDVVIDVGEDAVINVTVPKNATGWVHVTIGNQTYAIKVENGTGSTAVSGLASGTYNLEAVYLGDEQYLPSNNTFTIKVSKVPSSVNISVENITVGDKAVIDISVPEDICGNVTVTVNGKNHTVYVSGGHGTLVIPDLPVGNYTVEAIFDGCKKYEPSNNTANFTVSKIKSVIRPIDLGNNTVVVVVPENATGNVTIKVGDNTYVANVTNGTATITLDKETPGVHDITVIYSGDDNHTSTTVDSTVKIIKQDAPIKVSVKDIKVGDDEVVTVTLPKDATGKVTFEIDGRKYTVNVKDGKATVHIPNLVAGSKTISVSYSGDAKYLPNTSTAKFKVSKRESTISAKSKNINVGTDEVIVVNVPKDATGRVLVNINGVGYYANVINGVAKVIIPELPSGKYTAKVTYEGNAKYLQSKTITTTFTVSKVKTPIRADGDDIEQGQEATVIVNVPDDATGTVTIGVNGNKFTKDVENGKAVFEISGLKKGDYNVEASYSGDKKYEANNTITDIIVKFHDDNKHESTGNGEHQNSAKGVTLADYPTGNPIFALLLILVVLVSTQIRRFKK